MASKRYICYLSRIMAYREKVFNAIPSSYLVERDFSAITNVFFIFFTLQKFKYTIFEFDIFAKIQSYVSRAPKPQNIVCGRRDKTI